MNEELFKCKKCGKEQYRFPYCKDCFEIITCKACGRKSFGKDYCLRCYKSSFRKRR